MYDAVFDSYIVIGPHSWAIEKSKEIAIIKACSNGPDRYNIYACVEDTTVKDDILTFPQDQPMPLFLSFIDITEEQANLYLETIMDLDKIPEYTKKDVGIFENPTTDLETRNYIKREIIKRVFMEDQNLTLFESIINDFFCTSRCKTCPLFALEKGEPTCNLDHNSPEKCQILVDQLNLTP